MLEYVKSPRWNLHVNFPDGDRWVYPMRLEDLRINTARIKTRVVKLDPGLDPTRIQRLHTQARWAHPTGLHSRPEGRSRPEEDVSNRERSLQRSAYQERVCMNLATAWLLILLSGPTPVIVAVRNEAECLDLQRTVLLNTDWAVTCRPLGRGTIEGKP